MSDSGIPRIITPYKYMDRVPDFECLPEQWGRLTYKMTEKGKQSLANMLAHHCLPIAHYDEGWLLTREDLLREYVAHNRTTPYAFVTNDGAATYNFVGIPSSPFA